MVKKHHKDASNLPIMLNEDARVNLGHVTHFSMF
jgi:hypothetical protein